MAQILSVLLYLIMSSVLLAQNIPLDPPLVEEIPVPEATTGPILVLPLSDEGRFMVDQVQAEFIIGELEKAEAGEFSRVILMIDTYGGVVFSAREITEALLRLNIPTTAYVETKAISAGAFIAWACDEIVMEAKTTIGDAQMIIQTAGGMETAPEKAVTVFRSDWKKSSHIKERSFALAQGFFDASVEVLQVGTPDKFDFILRDEYDALPEKERLPIISTVSKKDQLLTLFAEEAEDLKLVTVYESFSAFLKDRNIDESSLNDVAMNTNQKLMRILSMNSWIFLVLTLIGLNGVYVEIKAPGFGIPGFTALVCFTIVFGANYLLGTASGLEMAVFVLGLLFCVAEIFVLPGLGIAGFIGLFLMFGSLILASFPSFGGMPTTDFQWNWLAQLATGLVGSFVGSIVVFVFLLPRVFKLPGAKRAVLLKEFRAEDGYVMDTTHSMLHLVGSQGVTRGELRPVGRIQLEDGSLLDVISQADFIKTNTTVTILAVEGNRILVGPAPSSDMST